MLVSFTMFIFSLQKVDVTSRAVMEIMTKTIEYLQPNPGKCWPVQLELLSVHLSLIDSLDLVGFSFLVREGPF